MTEKESIQYFGKVKWFGNKQTGDQYGFIEEESIGDIFVHGSKVKSGVLSEGVYVVFNIVKSKKDENKFEAINVESISSFRDLTRLFQLYDKYLSQPDYQKQILESIRYNTSKPNLDIGQFPRDIIVRLATEINKSLDTISDLKNIDGSLLNKITIVLQKYFDVPINNNYSQKQYDYPILLLKVIENLDENLKFGCWLLNIPVHFDENQLIQYFHKCNPTVQTKYFYKFPDKLIIEILSSKLKSSVEIDDKNMESIIGVLLILKSSNPNLYETLLKMIVDSPQIKLKYILWYKHQLIFIDTQIAEYLINNLSKTSIIHFKEIFKSITKDDFHQIIDKIINILKSHKISNKDSFVSVIYDYIYSEKIFSNKDLLNDIFSLFSNRIKLEYWLDDKIKINDYRNILDGLIELDYHKQILITKKLFWQLQTDKVKLTVKDCDKILTNTSRNKYDISLLIIFFVLKSYINKNKLNHRDIIVFIIFKLVKGSSPNLDSDLFEKCSGRANLFEYTNNGKSVYSINKSNQIPDGILFCEGRKAINKKDSTPVLEKEFEFYWCRNKPCFQNELRLVNNKPWKNYTLFDVLQGYSKINEDSYSFILGVLNKFNTYLSHLKCRSCQTWLTPEVSSNYALERVNHFHCNNENCREFHKSIYISHCLNFQCNEIIDSRDSQQCPNGWYICDYCLACCDDKRILQRKGILKKTGQEYKGSDKGHRESNQIFCFKCGKEMEIISSEINIDKYEKSLKWLNEKKDDKKRVVKSGTTKTGKKWYLIKQEVSEAKDSFDTLLKKLHEAGLNIKKSNSSSSYENSSNFYLISEKNNNRKIILKCSNTNCKQVLNLDDIIMSDRDRVKAMTYHTKISDSYKSILFKKGS